VLRLLLDTHTLLWAIQDDPQLDAEARRAITDPSNEVYVSSASVWEISIKRAQGRLETPDNLAAMIAQAEFAELAVSHVHGELAGALPLHHRDPFDRMLVAQAQAEDLVLVTRDPHITSYDVQTMLA
jgi:PIN domain nuclease of toxin-antitoxin system